MAHERRQPMKSRMAVYVIALGAASTSTGSIAQAPVTSASSQVQTVGTPIGDVKLQFGLPANSDEERRIYDQMDFQRATQTYIWAIPFVAMAQWKYAHLNEIGAAELETVLYMGFKDKI